MRHGGFSKIRFGSVTEGFISAPIEPQKFIGALYAVRIEDENACCLATTEHTGTKLLRIPVGFDEEVSLKEKVRSTRKKQKKILAQDSQLVVFSGSKNPYEHPARNTPLEIGEQGHGMRLRIDCNNGHSAFDGATVWLREFTHTGWKTFLSEHEKQWKKAGEAGYEVKIEGACSVTPHQACRGILKLWVREGFIIRTELHLSRDGYDAFVHTLLL